MSKKPQSIYVDEVIHARLAQMVEYATGGHGNLGGFFAFIEDTAHALLGPAPIDPTVREYLAAVADSQSSTDPHRDRAAAAHRYGLMDSTELRAFLDSDPTDMRSYSTNWERAVPTLPWHDPAPAHVIALWLLKHRTAFWQCETSTEARAPLGHDWDSPSLAAAIESFHLAGQGQRNRAVPLRFVGFFPLAWRRGRVDYFPRDRTSTPASFYLDASAHAFFYTAFGNPFFTAAEAKLDRLLTDPAHWIDINAESQFLEHGRDLLQLEKSYYDPVADGGPTELKQPFWATTVDKSLGWAVNRFPTARIAHQLDLDTVHPNADELTVAFLEKYELPALHPSASNAYRIAKKFVPSSVSAFEDPVEYHLFHLLQEYVRTVLPDDEQDVERTTLPILATLSQSWVLPTTKALEAYSGARAEKTTDDAWRLVKSRKQLLTCTNTEAYHLMWALWSTLPPLTPYHQLDDFFLEATGYDNWLEAEADGNTELSDALRTRSRFSFTIGPDVIVDLLSCLRRSPAHQEQDAFLNAYYAPCTQYLRSQVVNELLASTRPPTARRSRSTL